MTLRRCYWRAAPANRVPPSLHAALVDAALELAGYPLSPAREAAHALTDAVTAAVKAGMADDEILEALEAGDPTVDWATVYADTHETGNA